MSSYVGRSKCDRSILVKRASREEGFDARPYENLPMIEQLFLDNSLQSNMLIRGPVSTTPDTPSITRKKHPDREIGLKVQKIVQRPQRQQRSESTQAQRPLRDDIIKEAPPPKPQGHSRGRSRAAKEREIKHWVIGKRQMLNQVYETTYVKDIERAYHMKLPEDFHMPRSSLFVLQNDNSLLVDAQRSCDRSMRPRQRTPGPRETSANYNTKRSGSKSTSNRSSVSYNRPHHPEAFNDSTRIEESPSAPTGTNRAYVRKGFGKSPIRARTPAEPSTATFMGDKWPLSHLQNQPPPSIQEESATCRSYKSSAFGDFHENELVEMALLDSDGSTTWRTPESESFSDRLTPEHVLKTNYNLNKQRLLGKVYRPILEKSPHDSTEATIKSNNSKNQISSRPSYRKGSPVSLGTFNGN